MCSNDDITEVEDDPFELHRQYVEDNNLEALEKIILETGLVGDKYLYYQAIRSGNLDIVKLLSSHQCPMSRKWKHFKLAIKHNHLNITKHLIEAGYVMNCDAKEYACSRGNLHFLQLMVEKGIELDYSMRRLIMSRGDIECVKFLINIGHIFAGIEFLDLCELGDVELLKLVYESGHYVFNDDNADPLMYTNSLEIVKYLCECTHWRRVYNNILGVHIVKGNLDIVKYFLDKDMKLHDMYTSKSLRSPNSTMIEYLHKIEAPFNVEEEIHYCERYRENYKYYHNNIYNRKLCKSSCEFCVETKVEALWNEWYLSHEGFESYNQWFPREVLEDVINLCLPVYKPDCLTRCKALIVYGKCR